MSNRDQMNKLIKQITRIRWTLENYKDTHLEDIKDNIPRACIVLPDGKMLGMGFATHMHGDPGGFKSLGFKEYYDFYDLPKEKRNDFLDKGLIVFNEIFTGNLTELSFEELEKMYKLLLKGLKELADEIKQDKNKTK